MRRTEATGAGARSPGGRPANAAPRAGRRNRVVRPNPDGPGWHWAEEGEDTSPPQPLLTLDDVVRPAGADGADREAARDRQGPEAVASEGGRRPRGATTGWIPVERGRARVVRPDADGRGWHWAEADG